ncbi:MAG: hypothetical protein ACE5NG_05525 [bacterium]
MKIFNRVMLLVLYLNLNSFSHWHLVQQSHFQQIDTEKPLIRVVLADGSVYEARNYKITADSLFILTGKTPFYQGKRSFIPVETVAIIERQETDTVTTALVLLTFVVTIYALHNFGHALSHAYSSMGQ